MGKDLRLQIPYWVVEEFVMKHYHQEIRLAYESANTVSIKKTVKIILEKEISVNISIWDVVNDEVTLSYQIGYGLEIVVKGALMWFREHIKEFVEELNNNRLKIHLDKIPQLKDTLEKINITGINFETEYINILFSLKNI